MQPKDLTHKDVAQELVAGFEREVVKLTYAELLTSFNQAFEQARELELALSAAASKLEVAKQERIQRQSELAMSGLVGRDPQLERAKTNEHKLRELIADTRQGISDQRVLIDVFRAELAKRAERLNALAKQGRYGRWATVPEQDAMDAARKAVVEAILSQCGHHTNDPAFVDVDTWLRGALGSNHVEQLLREEVERVTREVKLTLIKNDNQLG